MGCGAGRGELRVPTAERRRMRGAMKEGMFGGSLYDPGYCGSGSEVVRVSGSVVVRI